MRSINIPPKYVFVLSTILLIGLASFSRDLNKPAYQNWNRALNEIHLLSHELSAELLTIRAGFAVNYDAVTQTSKALSMAAERLSESVEDHRQIEIIKGILRQNSIFDDFSLDISELYERLVNREEHINRFKSEFSIYKNSDEAVFELIDELRSHISSSSDWQQEISELERAVIQGNRLVELGMDTGVLPLIDNLDQLKLTQSQKETLRFLSIHIKNIEKYLPNLGRLVNQEIESEAKLDKTIKNMKKTLHDRYAESYAVTRNFIVALIALASFMVIYGAMQARRALQFSDVVQEQNRTLETRVEKRTKELEGLLGQLQAETAAKQGMIEDLKRKDLELQTRETFFRSITETATNPIVLIDSMGVITFANTATYTMFERDMENVIGNKITTFFSKVEGVSALLENKQREVEGVTASGNQLSLTYSMNEVDLGLEGCFYAAIFHDMTDFKQMESDLAHAHKLESVGQLAAGIAHEINTPAQFISDNLMFLTESVGELFQLIDDIEKLPIELPADEGLQEIKKMISDADLEYLSDEVPTALKQSSEGIMRVATIVRAMKDYSHPGEGLQFSDLNAAIESTTTVSRSEWKYFAKLETDFDNELPLVECVVSDINQVVLNMVVNAAHAIVDKFDDAENKDGVIKISTRCLNDNVIITINDNGNGMPEQIKAKIFDPFFTTKEVGKGTGQGLSIAHKLVCVKHKGTLEVDSVDGEGTCFTITLPLKQPVQNDVVAIDEPVSHLSKAS